jgi:hypothetical protein
MLEAVITLLVALLWYDLPPDKDDPPDEAKEPLELVREEVYIKNWVIILAGEILPIV